MEDECWGYPEGFEGDMGGFGWDEAGGSEVEEFERAG